MALGAFLTVRAAGAIGISMVFGAWFDRKPSVLPLCLALAAGVVGYWLLSTTTNFGLLLLIAGLPLGMSTAAFPLIFALAKVHIADADPTTAERGIAVLRASFSAAWGIGPAIGAVVVGAYDFNGLFWVSAAFSLLAYLPLGLRGVRAPERPIHVETTTPARRANLGMVLAASSLTLFSMAVAMGAVVLPITITLDLLGDKSQVGLAYSVCALLEVPVMMAIAVRPSLFLGYRGMAAGFFALALYFVAVALAPSVSAVITSQVLRAIGIGLVSCVGISYLQDLMPNRVGAAAALYSNTSQIGGLLAGLAAGGWAHAFGYHSLFWACALTSLAGLVFLDLGRRA
jgi:SET family sugar efflux transporter-like MFS transporter